MQTHPWEWDEQPPEWFLQYSKGQQFLGDAFMPMCWNCEKANEASVGEGQPDAYALPCVDAQGE